MLQLRDLGHPHEMTVEEYLDSNIAGRTELLGGIVFDVSPRNELHRYAVRKLAAALRHLENGHIVQVQDAVAVPHWKGKDAPEIDIAVISNKFYRPIPTSADAFAFIEVSDTTYRCDRDYKFRFTPAPAFRRGSSTSLNAGLSFTVLLTIWRSSMGRCFATPLRS